MDLFHISGIIEIHMQSLSIVVKNVCGLINLLWIIHILANFAINLIIFIVNMWRCWVVCLSLVGITKGFALLYQTLPIIFAFLD